MKKKIKAIQIQNNIKLKNNFDYLKEYSYIKLNLKPILNILQIIICIKYEN